MTTRKLEISPTCYFEVVEYDSMQNDLTLEYTEHASDHWCSNTHTVLTINKEQADNIINFLSKAFDKENQQ